jgi:type I restriction enzyme S subunit
MAEVWQTITVADLGRVVTGKTPPTAKPQFYGEGYPFITPTDMGGFRYCETARQISEAGRESQRNLLLPAKTVCVTCIASVGKMCMTDRPSFTNQQINSVIADETRHDPFFVYYLLQTRVEHLKAIAGGAATPIINKTAFSEIEVSVPPLPLQRRIAGILSAYDELMENSQRRIRILESMARALYREWFVHFRYPGHESVPRVASPVGPIPEGWEVKKLGDTFKTVLGGTPSRVKAEFWEGGTIPWINSGKVNALRITSPSELITELALERSAAKLMPKGTTVLAITGATLGQVSYLEIETTANQSVVGIVDPSGLNSEWIYLTVTDRIKGIINHASGGAQQHINKEVVNDVLVAPPPAPLAKEFQRLVAPMFREVATLLFKIQNLRQTRDLLLPRLLSGQVELKTN